MDHEFFRNSIYILLMSLVGFFSAFIGLSFLLKKKPGDLSGGSGILTRDQAIKADLAEGSVLENLKEKLSLRPFPGQPFSVRFMHPGDLIELTLNMEIENQSSHPMTLLRLDWHFFVKERSIASGIYKKPLKLDSQQRLVRINLRETLLESQKPQVQEIKKGAPCLWEVVVRAQVAGHEFRKKFRFYDLRYRASDQGLQAQNTPKRSDPEPIRSRSFIDDNLQSMIDHASENAPLSVIRVDLDNFQKIAAMLDSELASNALIAKTASRIKDMLTEHEVLVHNGQDDFTVIAENCPLDKARILADQIRTEIEKMQIDQAQDLLVVTASLGVVTVKESLHYQSVLKAADQMLALSKHDGKNRVSFPVRDIPDY